MTAGDLVAMLYLPADNPRFLRKVGELGLRAVILDLEDSVAPESKETARSAVRDYLPTSGSSPPEPWVRINRLGSEECRLDLDAIVVPGLAGVVAPKVEAAEEVVTLDRAISALEERRGLPVGSVRIMPLIESARGVANAAAIAGSGKRLLTLGFGAADFLADLGLPAPLSANEPSPTLIHAKVKLVMACRLAGLQPPHEGAFLALRDPSGLEAECRRARQLGFRGKHAIHPDQVPVIQNAFLPTEDEVKSARAVLAAADADRDAKRGSSQADGIMVDHAVVRMAQQILALQDEGEAPPV